MQVQTRLVLVSILENKFLLKNATYTLKRLIYVFFVFMIHLLTAATYSGVT